MNYLKTKKADRPNLTERDKGGDHIEVECPVCGAFRPGICIDKHGIPGKEWTCDGCFSAWRRQNYPEFYT